MVITLKESVIRLLAILITLIITIGVFSYIGRRDTAVVNVYEGSHPTLIIDAGHGGADGGATSLSGVLESEINLEIVLRIERVAALYGVKTELTRTSSDIDYPSDADTIREKKVADTKSRVELVNSTESAVFVSIHQNIYNSGTVRGFQVMYAGTPQSEDFAAVMQSTLAAALDPSNSRTPSKIPSDVFIMNNIQCPAILIECGFLSNYEDEALLLSDAYQIKIAASVVSAYIGSMDTLESYYSGGNDES